MKISEVMTRGAAVVTPRSTLFEAAKLMRDHDIGALPVVDDGMKIVGIVTDRDIVIRALADDESGAPIGNVMSRAICCVEPDDDVTVAVDTMSREKIRRLPVVRNGELLGIVALSDLALEEKLDESAGEVLSSVSEPSHSKALH